MFFQRRHTTSTELTKVLHAQRLNKARKARVNPEKAQRKCGDESAEEDQSYDITTETEMSQRQQISNAGKVHIASGPDIQMSAHRKRRASGEIVKTTRSSRAEAKKA